ncbi:TetR/AcrR family transcriptional regulator [Microbispora hainanensis]|jgi:AcrR family transcriptional regulator|uniref:TetR/AcrR family transcriptional regulator n=1 Tax=Microbispora hainanensis TaxID=568844 RepID=A0ABZ1T1U3_9ACTN|nr:MULTISPECIES: TetR/AcrR family transcriptional regulator [Microbispora]NJP23398.1 TetR family transcriptional regulator [Microbispora sp. CL1-1]TQS16458.1 TetR family transcriptional regulator [Microbispora sp. SCL1-1]
METTAGLRERKKAETRQAIHKATMRLAVERGLDHVTVDDIVEAANVSRRTFSNYFGNKEDALLYGEEQRIRSLVRAVRERPAEESGWQALRGAVRDELEDVGEPEREWAVRTSLARRHPALLARQLANHAELERELVQAISDREGSGEPGADLKRRIMAAAFLVALRIATNIWIEEQEARPLSQIMEQALDEIARPFA